MALLAALTPATHLEGEDAVWHEAGSVDGLGLAARSWRAVEHPALRSTVRGGQAGCDQLGHDRIRDLICASHTRRDEFVRRGT